MSSSDHEPEQTEETTAAGWPAEEDTQAVETTAADPVETPAPSVERAAAPEPAPEPTPGQTAETRPGSRGVSARPSWGLAGTLIGVALVAGTGVGYALNERTGSELGTPIGLAARADLSDRSDGGSQGGGQPPGGFGSDGRMFGGERVQGTVSATTDSTITVESTSGTATYAVDSSTRIIVNGQSGTLSDVPVGETVSLLAEQSSSGDDVVRLLFVGAMPQGGPGQPPPNGGQFPGASASTTSAVLG